MTQTNNKVLKITGILMIISGAIGTGVGFLALLGIAVTGVAALSLGVSMGVLVLLTLLAIAGGIINLVAGILGVINASKPEKAKICIIFGILSLAVLLLGNIVDFVAGDGVNVLNLLKGVVLPALYLAGAFQNQKLAA